MKLLSGKDASMFTAKLWKQPKCPSIHKWIKKIRYTHTHTHILFTRNYAFCDNMDEPGEHYAKWNERRVLYDSSITYIWNL